MTTTTMTTPVDPYFLSFVNLWMTSYSKRDCKIDFEFATLDTPPFQPLKELPETPSELLSFINRWITSCADTSGSAVKEEFVFYEL